MTKLTGKSRICISATYRNGVPMIEDQEYVSDVFERKTDPGKGTTILAFSVPSNLAPTLMDAMSRGDVGLFIEGIATPTE